MKLKITIEVPDEAMAYLIINRLGVMQRMGFSVEDAKLGDLKTEYFVETEGQEHKDLKYFTKDPSKVQEGLLKRQTNVIKNLKAMSFEKNFDGSKYGDLQHFAVSKGFTVDELKEYETAQSLIDEIINRIFKK